MTSGVLSGVNLTFLSKCDIIKRLGLTPCFMAFFWAIFSAFFEMSDALIVAFGSSRASVMAIQPEPVPTSRMVRLSGSFGLLGLTPGR